MSSHPLKAYGLSFTRTSVAIETLQHPKIEYKRLGIYFYTLFWADEGRTKEAGGVFPFVNSSSHDLWLVLEISFKKNTCSLNKSDE